MSTICPLFTAPPSPTERPVPSSRLHGVHADRAAPIETMTVVFVRVRVVASGGGTGQRPTGSNSTPWLGLALSDVRPPNSYHKLPISTRNTIIP